MNTDSILTTLSDIWNFQLFQIGDHAVSASSILTFVFIILVFYIGLRLFNRLILDRLLRRFNVAEGTSFLLKRLFFYIGMLIGIILAFQSIGVDMMGLTVVAGFLSLGIGFGLQNVTSNFVAGLILMFERPIQVGDYVTVEDTEGEVMQIRLRSTMIRTRKNISIIVPNSDFVEGRVTNWSHGDSVIRVDVEVGVAYDSDLNRVLTVMKDIAVRHPRVLDDPEPEVHLEHFGDSAWDMSLRVWITDPRDYPHISSDLRCGIVTAFRANGIAIPFPQREVRVLKEEPASQAVEWKPLG